MPGKKPKQKPPKAHEAPEDEAAPCARISITSPTPNSSLQSSNSSTPPSIHQTHLHQFNQQSSIKKPQLQHALPHIHQHHRGTSTNRSKCSTSSLKSINSNSNMSSLTCVSSPHNSPARKQNQTSTYIPQSHPNVQSEQNKVASLGYITPDKQPNNCDTTNSTKTSILGEDTADKHSVNAQKSSILPNLLARNMKSHFQEHQPIGVSLTNGKKLSKSIMTFFPRIIDV